MYVGFTNNLIRRIEEHKENIVKGFTEKYNVHKLVYYEIYGEVGMALYREKQIKRWNKKWKLDLIEKENKDWEDLYKKLF